MRVGETLAVFSTRANFRNGFRVVSVFMRVLVARSETRRRIIGSAFWQNLRKSCAAARLSVARNELLLASDAQHKNVASHNVES